MRVCVFSQNNPGVYSGGRYHALMLAEALAHAGHSVDYITNAAPVFLSDFRNLPAHTQIRMHLSENFMPENFDYTDIDAVFVTPGRSDHPIYYNAARFAAQRSRAQVFLINFESGNWFNALAPTPRDLNQWAHWKDVVSFGGTVLSSAHESEKWAKDFYDPQAGQTRFATWSPPINTAALAAAAPVNKENRVTIMARLSDPHKGMQDIFTLLPDEMRGWTLTIISGSGDLSPDFMNELNDTGRERGIEIDVRLRPNDKTKFEVLSASKLLIFPSLFEGYGYPPIEALACNTAVAAYDLPVIRETCGDAPYYATHGDRPALKAAIARALKDPELGQRDLKTQVAAYCDFDSSAQQLSAIVADHAAKSARTTDFKSSVNDAIFVDGVIQPLNPAHTKPGFAQLQGLRFKRMMTREGRAYYTGRVLSKIRPVKAKYRTSVSECSIDDMGRLFIRGWRVGHIRATRVEARIRDTFSAAGRLGLPRPDIAKRFAHANARHAGFEINTRITGPAPINEPVDILFFQDDRLVDRVDAIVTRFEDADTVSGHPRQQKTPAIALVIDEHTARPGSAGFMRAEDIALSLQNAGLKPVLFLCGNPADIHDSLRIYEQSFSDVRVCDLTRPVMLKDADGTITAALKRLDNNQFVQAIISTRGDAPATHGYLEDSAVHLRMTPDGFIPEIAGTKSPPFGSLIPPRHFERLSPRNIVLLTDDIARARTMIEHITASFDAPTTKFVIVSDAEPSQQNTDINGHHVIERALPLHPKDILKDAAGIISFTSATASIYAALHDRAASYGIPTLRASANGPEAENTIVALQQVIQHWLTANGPQLEAIFDLHHGRETQLLNAIMQKQPAPQAAQPSDLEAAFAAGIKAEAAHRPNIARASTTDPYQARFEIDTLEASGAIATAPVAIYNRASDIRALNALRTKTAQIWNGNAALDPNSTIIATESTTIALGAQSESLKHIDVILAGWGGASLLTHEILAALSPGAHIITSDATLRLRFPLDTRIITLAPRDGTASEEDVAAAVKNWLTRPPLLEAFNVGE